MLALLLLAAAGLLWWSGSEGSLRQGLELARRLMPADQQLQYDSVSGSITGGGRIGRLQWSKPGVAVTIDQLQLEWSLRELWGRRLEVRRLSAERVQVLTAPQPEETREPFALPADLGLPLRLKVAMQIGLLETGRLDSQQPARLLAFRDIAARYDFDGARHAFGLDSFRYGQSSMQGEASLHATTLQLAARFSASLSDLVAGESLAMQAAFAASGTLAGGDAASLDLQLDVGEAAPGAPGGAGINARAILHPWRSQPAQQVDVQFDRLNAHAFFQQAPTTALRGSATVVPLGDGLAVWSVNLDVRNELPGAWDSQRLPLASVVVVARLEPDRIAFESGRADLAGTVPAGTVSFQGEVPFDQPAMAVATSRLEQVNLRPLHGALPRTSLSGALDLEQWEATGRRFVADMLNATPGGLDRDALPARQLRADVRMTAQQWVVEDLDLQVGEGSVRLRGSYAPTAGTLDLRAQLRQLPLQQVHRKLAVDPAARLSGELNTSGKPDRQLDFVATVSGTNTASQDVRSRAEWEIRSFEARGRWTPERLTVERVRADAFRAIADGRRIEVSLPAMNSVSGNLSFAAPGVALQADVDMRDQDGNGRVSLQLDSAEQFGEWVRGLPGTGELLGELRAQGAGVVGAEWQGHWRQWLASARSRQPEAGLLLKLAARTDGLVLDLPPGESRAAIRLQVGDLDLALQGDPQSASLTLHGEARANDARARVDARLQAVASEGERGAPAWNIDIGQLVTSVWLADETEPWALRVSENLQLRVEAGEQLELRGGAGQATLSAPSAYGSGEPLQVDWQPILLRRSASGALTLQSRGVVTGLQPAWADRLLRRDGEGPLASAGIRTDLMLRGEWDVNLAEQAGITARLSRERGDLTLLGSGRMAGIRSLELKAGAAENAVDLQLAMDSANAGVISARIGTQLERQDGGWSLPPTAPLSGSLRATVQDLTTFAFLAPPGWRIQGAMEADLQLRGEVRSPLLSGELRGSGLNLRSVIDGVELHDGMLRARLLGSRMEVDELAFQGGTGSRAYVRGFSGNRTPPPKERGRMRAHGVIDWSGVPGSGQTGAGIRMDMEAELQRMQVLVRHDRQMTLSGRLSGGLDDGRLRIRGDLTVDRASIVLPEAGAPTLGDDVVVVRSSELRNPSAAEARNALVEVRTRKPMDLELQLDLGSDLALEGEGITTRLEGELTARSSAVGNNPVMVFGQVRTVEGRYRAWGQELDVETGVVRFNGPYTNPVLDLLAIRPNIPVRAGVQVTGPLLNPRVQLYSSPELPEGEKLSWVVLGRATVMTGAEGSSMQQAALQLAAGQLSGRLASGLGLDELGLSDTGVRVGKRISNELYLTYQQGLAGAASTLYIFYDITRRLTVRAQGSEAGAIDLVYTIKFD